MSDTVDIWHPASGTTSTVTRAAFERRSRKLGWRLADDRHPHVTEHDVAQAWNKAAAPPLNEDNLNAQLDEKAQLRQILTDRGVTGWDGRTGVKKLRQLVEGSG